MTRRLPAASWLGASWLGAVIIITGFGTALRAEQTSSASESPPTFRGYDFDSWKSLVRTDLDPETRFRGMLAIARLGIAERRAEAAEFLAEAIEDEAVPIVRSSGYLALLAFGDEAGDRIRRGLRSEDGQERLIVLYAVADFFDPVPLSAAESQLAGLPTGEELPADSALPGRLAPLLAEILADRQYDTEDREAAIRGLRGIFRSHRSAAVADGAAVAERVRVAASETAEGRDMGLAVAAIELIGELGPHAAPSVPRLIEITRKSEQPFRHPAGDPGGDGTDDGFTSRPMAAVIALGRLGAVAEEAIPTLERIRDRGVGREIYASGLARRSLAMIRSGLDRGEVPPPTESP